MWGSRTSLRPDGAKNRRQGFAPSATPTSLPDSKNNACASRQTETAGGPNQTIKVGQMTISKVGHT